MDKINARCCKIREDHLEMLMNWRMDPDITRYMNTDPKLTLEGQKKWYQGIQEEEQKRIEERSFFYWLLEVDEEPAGFVSLVDMDYTAKRIYTGVYVGNREKRSLRLIIDIQWNLYRYAFEHLEMNKVCEEVFAENKAVNRILDLCGSTREGILRQHVYKNGKYYDMVTRGILKEEWEEKKKTLQYNIIEFE